LFCIDRLSFCDDTAPEARMADSSDSYAPLVAGRAHPRWRFLEREVGAELARWLMQQCNSDGPTPPTITQHLDGAGIVGNVLP
jgi:hypothetical protein